MSDTFILISLGAASGFVSGVTGFGSGLVLMGTLVTIMPVQQATVIAAVLAVALAITNLWSVRRDVPWAEILPTLATGTPAVAAGVYLLRRLDDRVLRLGVVIIILAGVGVVLWSPRRRRYTQRWLTFGAGALSGLLNGALGTGGPPLVLLTLLRGWEKERCKAYLSGLFLLMGVFRMGLLMISGVATGVALRQGALVLVPVISAWYLGRLVFQRVSTQAFRVAGVMLLVAIAVNLVAGL